ncbi:MAG: HK97 gp10 family phage protein [Ilumatobacteraceae bacterium]
MKFVPNQKGIDRMLELPGFQRPLEEIAASGAKAARELTPKKSGSARRKIEYGVRKVGGRWVGWFGSKDIAAHLIEFGGGRNTPHRPITKAGQRVGGSNFKLGR